MTDIATNRAQPKAATFNMVAMSMLLLVGTSVSAIAETIPSPQFPKDIQIPPLEPLVPPCADPAADHFIEIDITQRPPPGSTRVQRLSGWVSPDGIFHWPFVMRIRNIGDQPFIGKPGKQEAIITEEDRMGSRKTRVLTKVPFDQMGAHSGLAARFEFAAPLEQAQKGKFHRIYTLSINYQGMDSAIVNGRNGDCNLLNNKFKIEFDGSRKNWIFGK